MHVHMQYQGASGDPRESLRDAPRIPLVFGAQCQDTARVFVRVRLCEDFMSGCRLLHHAGAATSTYLGARSTEAGPVLRRPARERCECV